MGGAGHPDDYGGGDLEEKAKIYYHCEKMTLQVQPLLHAQSRKIGTMVVVIDSIPFYDFATDDTTTTSGSSNSSNTGNSSVSNDLHVVARKTHTQYAVEKAKVPNELVPFRVAWEQYRPVEFTDRTVLDAFAQGMRWADPETVSVQDLANRKTYENDGDVRIDPVSKRPLNPHGRTGMTGRGLLGRWGPNMANDLIIIWTHGGKAQMVSIKRKDTGEWAIPGGMRDNRPGDAWRRLLAGCIVPSEKASREELERLLNQMFDAADADRNSCAYRGYVDDARNTDNAWMETLAQQLECPAVLGEHLLFTGETQLPGNAAAVDWLDLDENEPRFRNLYGSHKLFVYRTKKPIIPKKEKAVIPKPDNFQATLQRGALRVVFHECVGRALSAGASSDRYYIQILRGESEPPTLQMGRSPVTPAVADGTGKLVWAHPNNVISLCLPQGWPDQTTFKKWVSHPSSVVLQLRRGSGDASADDVLAQGSIAASAFAKYPGILNNQVFDLTKEGVVVCRLRLSLLPLYTFTVVNIDGGASLHQ